MAPSTVTNSLDMLGGHNDNIGTPVKSPSPQIYSHSESEGGAFATQLPSMDRRKSLEKDARDVVTDSSQHQQQQQQQQHQQLLLSSTSYSFVHIPDKVGSLPPQQMRHVKESFETTSPASPRGHRGNQGIKAARQRFLLEKAGKLQEAKTASRAFRAEKQTSQTSSVPPCNRSVASDSSSRLSSTFQISAQPKALHRPMIPKPPQSRCAKEPMSLTLTNNDGHVQSCSYGQLDSAFQHPLLLLPNHSSQPSFSMKSRDYRVQNDWANGESLSITVSDLPDNITTRELWATFKHEGHIAHIRLCETARGSRDGKAHVKFRYVLVSTFKL